MAIPMAMQLENDSDDDLITTINTTPLVDVMLVLLIIFLITIPAVTASSVVNLPRETVQSNEIRPGSIVITIDARGGLLLDDQPAGSQAEVRARLSTLATRTPQPEVHILADVATPFHAVGNALYLVKEAGLHTVNFVTEPAGQESQ